VVEAALRSASDNSRVPLLVSTTPGARAGLYGAELRDGKLEVREQFRTGTFSSDRCSIDYREHPVVLLIDEIDRADEAFEATCWNCSRTFQLSIPELGTIKARSRPWVVLTE